MAHAIARKTALFTALISASIIVLGVVIAVLVTAVSPSNLSALSPAAGEGHQAVTPAISSAPTRACDYAHLVWKNAQNVQSTDVQGHPIRILKPGMVMTMEYLEGRVNLHVNDQGVITSVTCG